ncbi:DUF6124 family protein [Pseudomonas fluorescens]|uniref:DUF6124 family protein n=1 Tax=Pseudomonas TaxID=286 RepID=UPI00382320BB
MRPVYQPAHGRHPPFGSEGDGSYCSESLAAASDMARDIGDNPQRRAMLMLHQVIMLSELMVNRVLDGRRVPN